MSYFEDLSLRSIWMASSGDDGKTWRYASEVPNLPLEITPVAPYSAGVPVIRTPDNLTIVGIEHKIAAASHFWTTPDAGARASLVVMNYHVTSTAQPDEGSVIFRRHKADLL